MNQKLNGKEKLAFIEVIKLGTYTQIWLGFSLYSLTKIDRAKARENRK